MNCRIRTHDRSVLDFAGFYAPERVGRTRRVTPEGFLVLEGTPIARTGEQIYGAHELKGIKADGQGQIIVQRLPEEVFRPETLQSAEGKDFVIEHPPDGVDVTNWKNHTVGHVQNVRRGTGVEDDLILADILVKDPKAVEYVNKNLPQISAGYEADYQQTEPGKAVQRNIVINHVAAVRAGRAGARVAVRDSRQEGNTMAMLNAVEAGKVLDLGICFTGNTKADVSSAVTAVRNWVTPFCSGHVLTAEPAPAILKSGTIYAGELVRDAVNRGNESQRRLSRALDQLNHALNTSPPRVSAIEDAMELVESINSELQQPTQALNTEDTQAMYRNKTVAERRELKDMNTRNAEFWKSGGERSSPHTSRTADQAGSRNATADLTRINHNQRDYIARLNDANQVFHHGDKSPRREWEEEMGLRK